MFHKLRFQSNTIVIFAIIKHKRDEIHETKEQFGICSTYTTRRKTTTRFDFGFHLGGLERGFVD
jgi:hypothetical protein